MEIIKNQANELFRTGKYNEAIQKYSDAINAEPCSLKTAAVFANRSFASLKLELYGDALVDANKAISIDPNYIKAYYRRAAAYMALQKNKPALEDLKKVAALQEKANNPDRFVYEKIKACEKIIRTTAFERAIAVEGRKERPIAHSIEVESYTVDDDYDGARLVDDKTVDLNFVKQLIEQFKKTKQLHVRYVIEILRQAYILFSAQPSLIDVSIQDKQNFIVVGDIHGQFFDLLTIFDNHGLPKVDSNGKPITSFLFNGDVVDRGSFSVECIVLLLSLKLLYPENLFISRGNHETQSMNQMYGFRHECTSKYSMKIYEFFSQVFQMLPLAHCLNGYDNSGKLCSKVLVMHGGLFASDDVKLEDIKKIDRNKQPPCEGIMCELLWSDPMDLPGRAPSKRGIAIAFGPDVTEKFCKLNGLNYIIRSHEVKQAGYEVAHNGKCITVFSAPNYCDTMGNDGAVVLLKAPDLQYNFDTFVAKPHPKVASSNYADQFMNFL